MTKPDTNLSTNTKTAWVMLSFSSEDDSFVIQCESVANERQVFYGLYGGLFLPGYPIRGSFIFAAVLIIY